jgi:hypothetical protein
VSTPAISILSLADRKSLLLRQVSTAGSAAGVVWWLCNFYLQLAPLPCPADHADKVLRLLRCNKWRARVNTALGPPGEGRRRPAKTAKVSGCFPSCGVWVRCIPEACVAR